MGERRLEAFHRDFDASVVAFFREHLVNDGETR
jgi:hypothetical protein